MKAIITLADEVEAWREQRRAQIKPRSTPEGRALNNLNREWSARREELIGAEERAYLQRRRELTEAVKAAEAQGPQPTAPKGNGRPRREDYPDGVKILAYLAHIQGTTKGLIRAALAPRDTAELNRVLVEGKALYKAAGSKSEYEVVQ